MSKCEVPVQFDETDEIVTIRDKTIIEKIPVFLRSIQLAYPDWEQADVVLEDALYIPFNKEPAEFVFDHVRKYNAPDMNADVIDMLRAYSEANEQDVRFLLDVMGVATYLECDDFHQAIGFVVAKKLNGMDVEAIGEILGQKVIPEKELKEVGWLAVREDS